MIHRNPDVFNCYPINKMYKNDKEVLALIEEIKHPLWKKIFTPLNILLFLLFAHWGRERFQSHRPREV
jgi:hypothetical protein